MSAQLIAVCVLVALAAAYLARGWVRAASGGGCDTGCGKCAPPKPANPEPGGRIPLDIL